MEHWLQAGSRDLSSERIQTERCIITPFSFDAGVDMAELTREFCKANKDLFVNPFLPTLPEEIEFVTKVVNAIMNGDTFENFILEKETRALIGCIGLNNPEEDRMNIGLWIRESEHGK
jgi:RimJ/RimL family protein N-acetyltransferase